MKPGRGSKLALRSDCLCGQPVTVRCICQRGCCDDHAVMTVDGVRCQACMRLAEDDDDAA